MNITEDMIDNFCLSYFGSKMDFSTSKTAANQRTRIRAALENAVGFKNHPTLPDPFSMELPEDMVVTGEFQPEDLTVIESDEDDDYDWRYNR